MSDIKEVADAILSNDVIERHSLFQLQCFVLAKEPTIQGKLHQCLREIKARRQSIDALDLETDEQRDKLELIDIDVAEFMEKNQDEKRKPIRLRSFERQRKAVENNLKDLEKKRKDVAEELQFFCSAFDQLSRREKLKPWDDPEVQKDYWNEKLRFEVNTRLLVRQLPDIELMKTILCLHDDSQIKQGVVKMLKDAGGLPQKHD